MFDVTLTGRAERPGGPYENRTSDVPVRGTPAPQEARVFPSTASNGIGRRTVPFDFAQGRLSPGCRRAQDDIPSKQF